MSTPSIPAPMPPRNMLLKTTVNVYLAGKISKNCWRHEIVPNLRGTDFNELAPGDTIRTINHFFDFSGPFFFGCDHGCSHGASSHGFREMYEGCGCQGPVGVPNGGWVNLKQWLDNSDMLFAWLDGDALTAHGTIMEIGYAAARGIPIYIAKHRDTFTEHAGRELWLPLSLATKTFVSGTLRDGFETACKLHRSGW